MSHWKERFLTRVEFIPCREESCRVCNRIAQSMQHLAEGLSKED